ncbi:MULTISPECIES: acireductone synthase [Pseudoalteromonas]|uniref:Enolase-phosphatase E1 n=1 Tax=Pseudoalteromonas amylolytica TaxID=1859457 RepID=A0A1S1N199_9GAMM|nr:MULTISPECIES: acireductone synthase [Pseudoalteromonas]OHU91795.1 2,3-diketo-5-methylthio-1-phosphopentane phosphatase [Pseudoalteromonas sp. JW3]OHU93121.1 2,3-diketo-5-methylthio-1-phosphopentane phosphatase [Pseudoalteromonas amylolytica]
MIKAIVTDIEGTITRISFVKEILFPYAVKHLEHFVRTHQQREDVRAQIHAVRNELDNPDASIDEVIAALLGWIKADKKVTPLKQLQGYIWQSGYEEGDFTGHLYPDAYEFLCAQKANDVALYVYSSGSVKAQQLLFAHSDFGDIRHLFSDYFDTRVGAKQQPLSYQAILAQLPYPPEKILFLSDVVAELDAAKAAGMKTLQLWRDAQPQSEHHPVIENFNQFEASKL